MMFDNIGGKIKTLAVVVCVLGIICFVIIGMVMLGMAAEEEDEALAYMGFGYMIGGSILSWIGSFFLYGFGELIENSAESKESLRRIERSLGKMSKDVSSSSDQNDDPEKVEQYGMFCGKCGNKIAAYPCPHCGNHNGREKPHIPVKVFPNEYGYITCPSCELVQHAGSDNCQQCGQLFINGQPGIPFWCAKCGQTGPYGDKCPYCGSTLKIFNQK